MPHPADAQPASDTPSADLKPLNARERRFADEYLVDYNQTQAAIRAGYAVRSARQQASRLMTKENVQAAIKARKAEQDIVYQHRIMGKYEVLARLSDIAAGDIGDFPIVDENGKALTDIEILKKAKELGLSKLIKEVDAETVTTTYDGVDKTTVTLKMRLYSAHDGLRDLGKYHVLFTDKAELTGKDGGPITWKQFVEQARAEGNDDGRH